MEVDFHSEKLTPTTTVLNYLRATAGLTGVKEGCSGGDCGSCTVVIAEPNAKEPRYKAYNSCLLFLPMLNGKQLITVESLESKGQLHPIQRAMIDADASQCGYCTPGFIMSIFALYKNSSNPNRDDLIDALTGNLCRCTGYRPIFEAAMKACACRVDDQFSQQEKEVGLILNQLNETYRDFAILTNSQKYFKPQNLKAALEIKNNYKDILILNGATDIAPKVTKEKRKLKGILDLSVIGEIKTIRELRDGVRIGSGACLEEVKNFSKDRLPALYDSLKVFGSRQIRNAATLGGNIANASPVGDTLTVLMAYGASLSLESLDNKRSLKVSDFIIGYRKTDLRAGEIITSIFIPYPKENVRIKWYKIAKRKDLDISTVNCGFRLELSSDGKVKDIRLIYGGMAAIPRRAERAERVLVGRVWSREMVEKALPFIDESFTPFSDVRSSAEGRKIMARNLLRKFWVDSLTQGSDCELTSNVVQ